MEPMFDWDAEGEHSLKALPCVISWSNRADDGIASTNIDTRKLLAIIYHYHYQFALTTHYATSVRACFSY